MTNEELLSVAEIVERLVARFHKQADDHEAKMVEHRAAFGVRTEADAKIIAGLREEVSRLNLTCSVSGADWDAVGKACSITVDEYPLKAVIRVVTERDELRVERDSLRAEVAELKTQLRSQTPKHPVKAGEYVKRLTGFNTTPAGEIGRVTRVDDDAAEIEYEVKRPNGETGVWCAKNCEPCDPPEAAHAEPDLTQLHAKGKEAWSDVPNATQWVEEMRGNTEATHDTEAGKAAAAEAAVKTEPVADEIKVGDLVEVFQARCPRWTAKEDLGLIGRVARLTTSVDNIAIVTSESYGTETVALADVRKVTT